MDAIALALFIIWFFVAFVLRTVVQYRTTGDSGLRGGMVTASFGSAEQVAGWAFVGALGAGLAAPILGLGGLGPVWSVRSVELAGAAVTVVGIALTFMAQMAMGRAWRIGVDTDEVTDLVTDGAFAMVRNPIFSAMLTTAFGLVLMVPNWVALVGIALLITAIELQVRAVEEPHLRRLHGASYGAYEQRVGRFAPGLGRR